MAKKQLSQAQLSLDDLLVLLDEKPGELHKLPIEPQDIGGELLAILSKGLYTNPLDCIREYVQNAVDAKAQRVTIKITGNSVIIHDNGNGMDVRALLQARQFGLSAKSLAEHVGFRGIGIYSGFDLCRRLRITSKRAGESHLNVMVFEFAAMKQQLDTDRLKPAGAAKISLIELLSEHTRVGREPSDADLNTGFTIVELHDISDVHIRQLSNRHELRRYLLQNLPIDFAASFPFRHEINEKLSLHVPGYNPITITLQSDGLPDETVDKYPGFESDGDGSKRAKLQSPSFGYIVSSQRGQVAYYWAALTSGRGRIDKDVPMLERPRYEGLVYKVKGFSVGSRDKLRAMFGRKPQLYTWFTGEIYVLDPTVIPNAERNDFETNPAKVALELAIHDKVDKELLKEAEKYQAQALADERLDNYKPNVATIEAELASGASDQSTGEYQDDFERYSRLDTILGDLQRQRKSVSPEKRTEADELIKRVERAQRQLRKDVEAPPTETQRKQRASKKPRAAPALPLPPPDPPPVKTLPAIIQEAGWELTPEATRLVELVQSSLDEVLSVNSAAYRNLLRDIEAKIMATTGDQ